MIPDPMDQAEGDTTGTSLNVLPHFIYQHISLVSTTHSTSRSLEQQQQNSNHNKYPWYKSSEEEIEYFVST